MSATAVVLPTFPSGPNPRLRFREWKASIISAAAVVPGRRHGLVGYLVSGPTYAALYREQFEPTAHPGHLPSAGAQYPAYKDRKKTFERVDGARELFKASLTIAIAGPALATICPQLYTNSMTLADMWAALERAYGTPTVQELAILWDSLLAPLITNYEAFVLQQASIICQLREHGMAPPERALLVNHKRAISGTPHLAASLNLYDVNHRLIDDQNLDELITHLRDADAKAKAPAAAELGYGIAPLPAPERALAVAAAVAPKSAPRPHHKAKSHSSQPYCWTHGFRGHSSVQCHRRADGHITDATAADRRGGNSQEAPSA